MAKRNATVSDSGSSLPDGQGNSRRKKSSERPPWRDSLWIKIAMLMSILIISALVFPKGQSIEYNYQVNEITNETIIAPFNFPILKAEDELEEDRSQARAEVPFVFQRQSSIVDTQIVRLQEFFTDLGQVRQVYADYQQVRDSLNTLDESGSYQQLQTAAREDSIALHSLYSSFQDSYGIDLTADQWQPLLEADAPDGSDRLVSYLEPIITRILRDQLVEGIYDISKDEIQSNQVMVQTNAEDSIEPIRTFQDRNEAWIDAKRQIRSAIGEENSQLVGTAFEVLVHFIRPNLIFQSEITERRQDEAIDRVPISKGIVLENEKIVDANTRVTPEIQRKLESLAEAKSNQSGERGFLSALYTSIGRLIFIGIVLFFFVAFILNYRPEIYEDNKHLLLLTLIFISFIILSYVIYYSWGMSEYIIPVTIAAMMLTIIYDARVAFFGIISLSMLLAVLLGSRMYFFITTIFASTLAIYAVRRLRTRNQIYYAILYILGAYAVGLFATELTLVPDLRHFGGNMLWATGNAVLSPLLAYGLIALVEMSFKITTDMTLLELSDLNNPLLKKLAMKAPGTYHHCVVVGNLAEAAAEAVGANSLLARVGAYYHDIGKMNKPEYFVENQRGGENKHDSLKPQLSALIIQAHVKEGIELAREHGLPKEIADFIPMHHGTMRMDYFYQQAMSLAEETGTEVNEADFRYEGPKPNTKETGIVMLCEAIEAGTRSIQNPSPQRFHQFIDMIFDKRLKDGQLDECDLTIKELSKMRQAFIPILFGMYHLRIEYPGQREGGDNKDRERRRNLKVTKP